MRTNPVCGGFSRKVNNLVLGSIESRLQYRTVCCKALNSFYKLQVAYMRLDEKTKKTRRLEYVAQH